jgi:hypothetical protein
MRLQDSVAEWADLDSSIIWNALWTEDGNVQTNAETDLMNFHPGNFTMDMSSVWSPGVLACADVCARLRKSRRAFLSLLYSLDVSLWAKSIELKEVNKGEHSQSPKNQNDFVLTELRKSLFLLFTSFSQISHLHVVLCR